MPRKAFLCEHCLTPYKTEDAAATCEGTHYTAVTNLKTSFRWANGIREPSHVVLEVPREAPFNESGPDVVLYQRVSPDDRRS
jgi:hypothetical protein